MKKKNFKTLFYKSKLQSIKLNSYFDVYENLFREFKNKPITFVEVGIFGGGSLFMWKRYFHPKSRIIGIDLNPKAKEYEKYGFEIFIGDQSKKSFWKKFFKKIGKVDVVLDDGGHTNYQQVITTNECVPMIRDNGKMVVEDVHTSFIKKNWYNPSKYSFINYSKKVIEDINTRFPDISNFNYSLRKFIYKIQFFESIVSFEIDRKLCKQNNFIQNFKKTTDPKEFRNLIDDKSLFYKIKKYFKLKTNFTYPIFLINALRLKKYFI